MTNKYTDGLGRKWEFEYIKDFYTNGMDYVEIESVWQVTKHTQSVLLRHCSPGISAGGRMAVLLPISVLERTSDCLNITFKN